MIHRITTYPAPSFLHSRKRKRKRKKESLLKQMALLQKSYEVISGCRRVISDYICLHAINLNLRLRLHFHLRLQFSSSCLHFIFVFNFHHLHLRLQFSSSLIFGVGFHFYLLHPSFHRPPSLFV
jgi:hypothetical protein